MLNEYSRLPRAYLYAIAEPFRQSKGGGNELRSVALEYDYKHKIRPFSYEFS